jgi:predicted Zn-dependent protease
MSKILTIIVFLLISNISINANNIHNYNDEELRLMYDSFIFSKDLKNAYQVTKKAIKIYPNSEYWHQKLAETALWTNKNSEALDNYTWIYKKTKDKKLADKLLKQMLATYQYKKAIPIINNEIKRAHDNKTIKTMLEVNDKIGKPQDSIKTLKKLYTKNPSTKYLAKILDLYILTGDLDNANDIAIALRKSKDRDIFGSVALSKYYFIKKRLKDAYEVLLDVKHKFKKGDEEYFQHLSDLGWYLGDYNNAAYGSLMLYRDDKARVVDLDRIKTMYVKKNISLIKDIAVNSMKKFKNDSIFLVYANEMIKKSKFRELDNSINIQLNDKNSSKILKNNPKFWLFKAKVDEYFKRNKELDYDLNKALVLAPNDLSIKKQILWNLVNKDRYTKLQEIVKEYEKSKVDKELYHPLSAAYFSLQKYKNALKYIQKALKSDPKNIDMLFLRSEIYSSLEEKSKKRAQLKEILDILTIKSQQDKNLLKDSDYLRKYLQASMEFASKKRFLELLEISKKHLTPKDYKELLLSYALKYKNYKEAQKIYYSLNDKKPQLEVSLAKELGELDKAKMLIKKYPISTPAILQIEVYEECDDIDKAIKIAKNHIDEDRENSLILDKLKQLYKTYLNQFRAGVSYRRHGDLRVTDVELYNFYYIAKGYGVVGEIEAFENSSLKFDNTNIDKNRDIYLYLGVRKVIKNGSLEAGITYKNKGSNRVGFKAKVAKTLNENVNVNISYEKNKRVTDQYSSLEVEGKKDTLSIQSTYKLTKNQYLTLHGSYDRYYLSNGSFIGDGKRATLSYNYILSHVYDSGIRGFYSYGDFTNSKKDNIKLLQNDYHDFGIGLFYGNSSGEFGSSLKPYCDIAALYSKKEKTYYSMIEAGLIGSISKSNYYKLGINYQNALRGISQEEFGVKLNYSQLY